MSELPPANWYPDPEVPGQQRYWDGTQWTEHRAPGAATTDPGAASGQPAGGTDGAWAQRPDSAPTWGRPASTSSGTTNGMAITSLVVGVVSLLLSVIVIGGLGGLIAVVLGIVAMRRIRDAQGAQGGRGLAIAGVVTGGLAILGAIIATIVFVFLGTVVEQNSTEFSNFFECLEEQAQTGQDLNC